LAKLHAVKALLSATVLLPEQVFENHSPFRPRGIGEQLAQQVDAGAREAALGYYPPVDYFQGRGVLDAQLLEVLDQLAWLATSLVREEVQLKLRPLFAAVQIKSMQALAYSMPPVRPGQVDALQALGRHFAPDQARFDLMLTLFRKRPDGEGLDSHIRRMVCDHLDPSFDKIDISNIQVVN